MKSDVVNSELISLLLRGAAGLSANDGSTDDLRGLPADFVLWCERERLLHQLIALSHGAGSPFVPVEDDQWTGRVRGGLAHQLRIELAAVRSISILEAAGIEVMVMKGLATAHLDHRDPALRESADVDLLIRPAVLTLAVEAFADAGIELTHSVQRGWWSIQHAITFSVDGVEVDLHHRPLHQGAGFLGRRLPLFANSVPIVVAGHALSAPSGPHRLIIAAAQNVLAAPSDRRVANDLDVLRLRTFRQSALDEAAEVGLGWVVATGMQRAYGLAGLDFPFRVPRSRRDRLLRWAYEGRRSVLRTSFCEIVLADPRTAARILWCDLFPGGEYLARRDRTRTQQLARQLGRLLPRRRNGE